MLEAKLNGTEKEAGCSKRLIALKKQRQVERAQIEAILRTNQALEAQVEVMERNKRVARDLSNAIASGLVQGLRDVVTGAKSAEEAMSQMLNNIADIFLQRATEMIAKAIEAHMYSLIAGRCGGAAGGAVPGGGGSFFPLGKGFSFDGGGYTGNGRNGGVDGRRVPCDPAPARNCGRSSGAMGRYSAGSAGGGGMRTIRFESTVINNVEYVTTEQAMAMSRQAADDGARRGAAGACSMTTLKNSRSQRAKLGMK